MTTPVKIQSVNEIGGFMVDPTGRISVNARRAYIAEDGHSYITINAGSALNPKWQAVRIQTNATLLKDEWIDLDRMVRQIATIRLNGIADLQNMGLVHNAGDLGSTIAEWQESSDMSAAEINMSGTTSTEKDRPAFDLTGVPIPIVRKDFDINTRNLLSSRRNGASLDTTAGQIAARLVAEKSEDMLFNGASVKVGGYSIYGYTTHPSRVTGATGVNWAASTAPSGQAFLNDVHRMIKALEAVRHYGPYNLYVNSGAWANLRGDYSASKGDNTILERILAEDVINAVKVSDQLASDSICLVQMTSDVVDLAVAQDLTNVNWQSGDGMNNSFAVFAAWVPRIKQDYAGRLGIAHYTTTT